MTSRHGIERSAHSASTLSTASTLRDREGGLDLSARIELSPPLARATSDVARPSTASDWESGPTLGTVLVRHPDGTESRAPVNRSPVSIGSSRVLADIEIRDEQIRPVHLRVSALEDGTFAVHGLGRPTVDPFGNNTPQPDQFIIVTDGEEIRVEGAQGEYVIHCLASDAVQAEP